MTTVTQWQRSTGPRLVKEGVTTPLAVAFVSLFIELNDKLGWTAQQVREEVFNFVKQGGGLECEWAAGIAHTADKYDITSLPETTKAALVRYATINDLGSVTLGYEDTVDEEYRQAAYALRDAAVGTTIEVPAKLAAELAAESWDDLNPPYDRSDARVSLHALGHRVAAAK